MSRAVDPLEAVPLSGDLADCFSGRSGKHGARASHVDARLPSEVFASTSDHGFQLGAARPGERIRAAARKPTRSTLIGDLLTTQLIDVVSLLELGRKSGVLSLCAERALASLQFVGGALEHVVYGDLEGPPAFFSLMTERSGVFEFDPELTTPLAANTHEGLTSLVLEGSRRLDEDQNNPGRAPQVPAPQHRTPACARPTRATLHGYGVASPAAVDEVELLAGLLSQGRAEGIVRYVPFVELRQMTEAYHGPERPEALICSDLSATGEELVSLLPPGAWSELEDGIDLDRGCLDVELRAPGALEMRVTVAHLSSVGALTRSLARSPTALILGIGQSEPEPSPRAQFDLEVLLAHLSPAAVVSVAGGSMSKLAARAVGSRGVTVEIERWEWRSLRDAVAAGLRHFARRSSLLQTTRVEI